MKLKTLLLTLLLTTSLIGTTYADFNDAVNAYNKKDYKTAFEEFKLLAEQGNLDSQYRLGMMFYGVDLLSKDYLEKEKMYFYIGDKKWYRKSDKKTAFKWFEKAAIKGHPSSQYQLGLMYYRASTDVIDILTERISKIREELEDASKNNTVMSWVESTRKIAKSKAIEWWLKAAHNDNIEAQSSIAFHYKQGDIVDKDLNKAIKWYKKAVEKGHDLVGDAALLGDTYYETKNYKEAVRWWSKSSDAGSVHSLINLLSKEGLESHISEIDMFRWRKKAAEKGFPTEQFNLGVMYANGEGVLKDYKEAVKWYRKAAEQGNADAQFNLGAMYANGKGVLKDLSKAKYWIKKAYENPEASASTRELAEKGWNQLKLWKY